MKNELKRQKIIDTAVTMFRETHNVKKVSLEDIAQKAGISPTTIYNHFGTREALVSEVVKVLLRQTLEQSWALIRSDIPFSQKLIGIINLKKDMISQVNGEIIDKIVSQDKTISPSIDEVYQNEVRPLWLEMLADGKKQGYIDTELNDEALLTYLDVLKAGFAAKQELMKNVATKVDSLMQLTRILFYGFLKKDIGLFSKEG
jgi:TetR/AcrR family transcriptional regulator, cholesterol catabolism regulator